MVSGSSSVVTNAADADRTALVCTTLINLLATDLRVQGASASWRAARDLPRLITRVKRDPTATNARAVHDAILGGWAQGLTHATSVLVQIGLTYEWLPQLIVADWCTVALGEASGTPPLIHVNPRARPITATPQPGESANDFARRVRTLASARWPTPGRQARQQGEPLARDVHWYYRAHLQTPNVSLHTLAKEYAVTANRRTDSRSVVRNGIARAKALLDLLCLPPGGG